MLETTESKSIAEIYDAWSPRLRKRVGGKAVTHADLKARADIAKLEAQMAAVGITDEAAKGPSGKRGSRKPPAVISIGKVVLKENEIEQLGESIEFAKEILGSTDLRDLDGLDEARETLDKLSKKKVAVSEYKRSHPEFDHYQVVSFSALTAKHLVDMGVDSGSLSRAHLNHILEVFKNFTSISASISKRSRGEKTPRNTAAIFERFWTDLTKDGKYINNFRLLKNNIGKKPEARARMLTDYILTQLMVFVHEHLNLIQFMFVELLLSSPSDPIVIEHKNTATLLTGSVDYAIMSSVDSKATLGHHSVEKGIRELISENSLEAIMSSDIWPTLQTFKHFQFTIIEEKRKDFSAKTLKDFEPQVTGEASALQSRTQQNYVLWCLSNGEDWIFGALNDGNKSRALPPMSIDDSDLQGSIKTILKMLILWTVCPIENFSQLLGL